MTTTTTSRLDPPVVPGLSLRVHDGTSGIAAHMAPIAQAANRADGVQAHVAEDELVNWLGYRGEHFDPARDVVLAELDGTLVGYAWVEWVDTTEGVREFRLGGYVHPDVMGRGIGRNLLAWQEAHAATLPAAMTATTPLAYGTWSPEERAAKRHLLERAGYEVARYFFEMRRTNLDKVDVPPMPEGLEIRPIGHDLPSQKQLWEADVEAFRGDHWGGFDASDANFERAMADPDHDPDLYVIAWDGDEIAGGVTNSIWKADNEAFNRRRGWLETVFVRRPWRRRGLGAAIVARSLVRLREAGMDEAMLGVDSGNPNGALGLYERAGFVVHTRSYTWRRPFEVSR
jgi:mycothiol synthase